MPLGRRQRPSRALSWAGIPATPDDRLGSEIERLRPWGPCSRPSDSSKPLDENDCAHLRHARHCESLSPPGRRSTAGRTNTSRKALQAGARWLPSRRCGRHHRGNTPPPARTRPFIETSHSSLPDHRAYVIAMSVAYVPLKSVEPRRLTHRHQAAPEAYCAASPPFPQYAIVCRFCLKNVLTLFIEHRGRLGSSTRFLVLLRTCHRYSERHRQIRPSKRAVSGRGWRLPHEIGVPQRHA